MDDDVDWDETGHSTAAYEAWLDSSEDLLTFLDMTITWAEASYAAFRTVAQAAENLTGDSSSEVTFRLSNGLDKATFESTLTSAVCIAVVAEFEVYLEDALQEAGNAAGFQLRPGRNMDGPNWKSLVDSYRILGWDLNAPSIQAIREKRHWAAHRRASVTSRAFRETLDVLAERERLAEKKVSVVGVRSVVSVLRDLARSIDPLLWRAAYLGQFSSEIMALAAKASGNGDGLPRPG